MKLFRILFFVFLLFNPGTDVFSQINYPGKAPGKAVANHSANIISLENQAVKMVFQLKRNQIHPKSFIDKANGDIIQLPPLNWFSLTMRDGKILSDKNFQLVAPPRIKSISLNPNSAKVSDHLNGKTITATFINKPSGLAINWEACLTDGANYIQQRWSFSTKDSLPIIKYTMLEIPAASSKSAGSVDGSPLVSRQMFFALEHPMSRNEMNKNVAVSYLPRQNALHDFDSLLITTVSGVTPKNQLRRGFLYYLERERSHPYRPFLHYNSWFDLSWADRKMEEASCLDRIRLFGDSLIKKRNVPLKAFLFDDGWDNNASLWQVSKSFPNGFTNMSNLAKNYGANLGLWISPWGGYDSAKLERLKYGRLQSPPFETNENGFSLSGPVYSARFNQVVTGFIQKYGVAILKFDGVGAGNGESGAGLDYQRDVEALLLLTKNMKAIDPDLYISLTVGTWPSPYWLNYGDATWRAGLDVGLAGTGSKRQQWITYRDAESYKNVVQRAPLYPLNSVMLHGICISNLGTPASFEMDMKNISDGIWSFFGSGTSIQELYVNPHLLTTPMWDCLAAAAKWSQDNADILQDTHWIGGDPAKGEVYGYAAWAPRKGVLTLRNPSSQTKTFVVNINDIFELPGNPAAFKLKNAINPKDKSVEKMVQAKKSFTITLAPYELKIWDAIPVKNK